MMGRRHRAPSVRDTLPGLGRVVRRFAPYLRRHEILLSGALFALLVSTATRLLEPWPLKFIIDRVVVATPAGGQSGIGLVDQLDAMTLLTLSAAAVVVIIGVKALMSYLSTVGFALVGSRVLTDVRNDLFRHILHLSMSFHTRAKAGDLTMRLVGDVGMLKETMVTAILPLAASVLVLAGMVGVMLWLNWQLALLAFLPLPLLWLSSVRISQRIQEESRKQRAREGTMAATGAESIAAMRVVQALSLEAAISNSFVRESKKSLKDGVKAKRLAAHLERTVDVLVAIATALVLWYGAILVLRGRLTPGDLLVFITYMKNSFRPVREYAKYTSRLSKAAAAGERIVDIMDEEAEVRDLPGAHAAPAFAGAVRFEQTSFAYGDDGQLVLDAVDLDVRRGERVAIIGPSGAGKSTFAALLLRLYDPTGGKIMIDGQDIRSFTIESLRAQISLVPQENLLFAASVYDNIALAAGRSVETWEVEEAARIANAHEFISRLPRGYATLVGERGATLSSGQRQRIAIARAALRRSPILILDEPTVGLDRENEREISDALKRLAVGHTTFIITHDLSLAADAERILHLDDGHFTEVGTHAESDAFGCHYAVSRRRQPGGACGLSVDEANEEFSDAVGS